MEHNIKPLETHHALTDLLDQQEKLDAKIIKVKAIVTHREQTMARCAATCASLEQLPFDHAAVRRADEQYLHAEEAWKIFSCAALQTCRTNSCSIRTCRTRSRLPLHPRNVPML